LFDVVTYAIGMVLFPVVKLLQIGAVLIIGLGCGVIVISIGFHRAALVATVPISASIDNGTRSIESPEISLYYLHQDRLIA
jgi:hypothetical protein